MVQGLLSDDRLNGQLPVTRDVGPELYAFLVDRYDIRDALHVIRQNCGAWGGGMWPLLPHDPHRGEPSESWAPLLDDATVDAIASREFMDGSHWAARLRDTRLQDHHAVEPLWSMLEANRSVTGHKPEVALRLPLVQHPWFISYLACFGDIDETLNPHLLRRAGLREDLALHDLVDVRAGPERQPSPLDLVRSLREATLAPRQMSRAALGLSSAPWSQDLQTAPTWTTKHWVRRLVGSNIAIVYEPGSVADLCLAWNLRAVHGLPEGLPLAIPDDGNTIEGLRAWSTPEPENEAFAGRLKGFGRPFALVSMSIDRDRLEALAEEAGVPWQVFEPEELLQGPSRPVRRSHDVETFKDGHAVVSGLDRDTAELIAHRPPAAFGLDLRIRVTVDGERVPPLPALRNDYAFERGWRDGGFDTQAPADGGPVGIEWPSGWAMLRAAIEPHGLTIRPSAAGAASTALMRRLGSFRDLDFLRDPRVLEELDEVARRRGISWFRKEVRRLAARVAADDDGPALERIEQRLTELTITGSDDQPSLMTVNSLTSLLSARQARAWMEWAERSGLLVRGVEFRCQACRAKGWRNTAELSPPVICGGCGEEVRRPFPADSLQFKYRPSQGLLEVMSADALPHLLCAGWFVALFRDGLVGAHPGVDFLDSDQRVVAEADVVLLFRDGSVALAECKRRAAGLRGEEIEKLEHLADLIDAMFTCYATPQWASQCGPIWSDLRRDLPTRRRFGLFGEQLLRTSRDVLTPLGVDSTDPTSGERHSPEDIRETFVRVVQEDLVENETPPRFEDHVIARTHSGPGT